MLLHNRRWLTRSGVLRADYITAHRVAARYWHDSPLQEMDVDMDGTLELSEDSSSVNLNHDMMTSAIKNTYIKSRKSSQAFGENSILYLCHVRLGEHARNL